MRGLCLNYSDNSRRATYAHRAYAAANPMGWTGYSSQMWGLTASDGPANTTLMLNGSMRQFHTYWARGVSLFESNDDGTLAPTAAGGAVAFAPEISIPALLAMRETYGSHLFSTYGFRDAFNPTFTATGVPVERGTVDPTFGWFDVDYLGIDQGPIIAMIENYRTDLIWRLMRANPHIVLGPRDVASIIHVGGTMLGSARCAEFRTPEGRKRALQVLEQNAVEGLVVIGGNGSLSGAHALSQAGFPVVGVASTIDNDLNGADITIGVDTALNTALEAIDRLKTTASSHQRAFVVEVMGRSHGYLALMVGIAGGADVVVIPEVESDPDAVAAALQGARQRAVSEHFAVVAPDIQPRREGGGRGVAQLAELELPDLVGQCLAGIHDVAVHLDDDVLLRLGGVVLEEVDRLLARPPQGMNPRVDHESHGAPHFVGELAELGVWVLIHAELGPEALGVEPPAFDQRGVATVPAELGQSVQLLGQRDLQVMAGHGLVQAERFHLPLGP